MRTKLLFIVTADWYFCSHRLALASAASRQGYEVLVATTVNEHGRQITEAGLRLIPLSFPRSAAAPWRDLALVFQLIRLCNIEQPDIVHNIALKPVLYGSMAALLSKATPQVINLLTGFGHTFTSRRVVARMLRALIQPALRFILGARHCHTVVQNPDDLVFITSRYNVAVERVTQISGSGVDLEEFVVTRELDGAPVVVFPARLLIDKGVNEFIEVARRLRQEKPEARFALVGDIDPQNPSSLRAEQLEAIRREGVVECWGWRDDMPKVFAGCHIVCLPSHREGLPKALLEAGAAGRAVVATDVPGCRLAVDDEKSGVLVPLGDLDALSSSLSRLMEDGETRRTMGAHGRVLAEKFSIERVVEDTLKLYEQQLRRRT